MRFLGIDQSLTAPGLCLMAEGGQVISVRTVRTGRLRGMERFRCINRALHGMIDGPEQMLASFEGYAYGKRTQGQNEGIELVGVMKWELARRGIPYEQSVTPMTLKKYLTGDGGADKDAVMAAVEERGTKVLDDNQADAYVLTLMLRDTYAWVAKGVRPQTLYQYDQVRKLGKWMRKAIKEDAKL